MPLSTIIVMQKANDELLDYVDTPKLRELYLAWCGENGFERIAIEAAA